MFDYEGVADIIQELRRESSTKAKQFILNKHSGYQPWLDYLVEVYNPFVTYGRKGDKNGEQDNLDNLKLCRSVNAGISATSINKAYPGLIPTASKMMKALDMDKLGNKSVSDGFWCGLKYDGNYVNIIVDKTVSYYTSGGHQYSHDNFDMYLQAGYVYMAERISGNGKLGKRRNCTLEGPKGKQYSKAENHYKIFDCVSLVDFEAGLSTIPYHERRQRIPEEYRAEEVWCHDLEDAETMLDKRVAEGYEGLVLKQPDMLWRDSKSRRVDFIKWKRIPTADLECVEEIEGTGNAKGYLGSIRLRDSMDRYVNVGSGLARNIVFPSGAYVGRVVEISYEHINPEGTYVQPRVVNLRLDKSVSGID